MQICLATTSTIYTWNIPQLPDTNLKNRDLKYICKSNTEYINHKSSSELEKHINYICMYIYICIYIYMSDFTFTFHFHALEKEMATHCNVLAWRIPGMGEPGGLPAMESHRVRHDWSDLAAAAAAAYAYILYSMDV